MPSYLDKISIDCESFTECTKKCPHYKDCLTKFKSGRMIDINNPSTLAAEINGFDAYESKDNVLDNFNINICEVPGVLINKAIISQFNSSEDVEVRNIISAALNKFNVSNSINVNSTIVKYDTNKYHFVFSCIDCNGLNDFVDYGMRDDYVYFYCRYCGKKHKLDLSKSINNGGNEQ